MRSIICVRMLNKHRIRLLNFEMWQVLLWSSIRNTIHEVKMKHRSDVEGQWIKHKSVHSTDKTISWSWVIIPGQTWHLYLTTQVWEDCASSRQLCPSSATHGAEWASPMQDAKIGPAASGNWRAIPESNKSNRTQVNVKFELDEGDMIAPGPAARPIKSKSNHLDIIQKSILVHMRRHLVAISPPQPPSHQASRSLKYYSITITLTWCTICMDYSFQI